MLTFDTVSRRWIPDTLSLDGLADVAAPAPDNGQLLSWQVTDEFPSGAWQPVDPPSGGTGPHSHTLNALTDVAAPSPATGQVLTWNGSAWIPQTNTATGGNFVVAPAGHYEIVGAGIFGLEGEPLFPPYNELEAVGNGEGQYLLRFPTYQKPEGDFTYIVKGTIVEPDLRELIDFDPFDPNHPATSPAVFQVVAFLDEGILIWITQPTLFGSLIEAAVTGQIDVKEFDNMTSQVKIVKKEFVDPNDEKCITVCRKISRLGITVDQDCSVICGANKEQIADQLIQEKLTLGGMTL